MKITGTKKLLISFFALTCVLATGLGVGLTRTEFKGVTAYAMSDSHVLPMADGEKASDATSQADIDARAALAEATGIAPEMISFFARSNGSTEKALYDAYLEDNITILDSILTFADMYSEGELVHNEDISDEDWYVDPDQAATYATTWGSTLHLSPTDTLGSYYSSKSGGITTESQYYRNSNFTMGFYKKWDNRKNSKTRHRNLKHNYMMYDIVWLEEGETYTFGCNLLRGLHNTYAEVTSSSNFLSTSNYYVDNRVQGYVRDYLFNATKADEATTPNPIVTADPDTSRNTYNDYLDEFGSTIAPTTASYTYSGAGGGANAKRLTIKPDAPSGAYMIVFQSSANQTSGMPWRIGFGSGSGPWNCMVEGYAYDGKGADDYSCYFTYATLVCRKGITKPELEYNDGVDSTLTKKEVSFNNTAHELIIKGDWGPGLMDYQIQEWDGTAWVASAKNTSSTNVKQTARGTRGSITKAGLLKFSATNAGQYKIVITPFRNWKVEGDAKDESDRTPVEFLFTIKPLELEVPSIIDDGNGVDNTQNLKYVFKTGRTQYISIYPAPKTWTEYVDTDQNGATSQLSEFTHSSNGVLTLSQIEQNVYTISINLKFNTATQTNLKWADGTTGAKTFKFEIGPMKVTVPDIIKDSATGITAFEKTTVYNGAYQMLSFMPVNEEQLEIHAVNKTTGLPLPLSKVPLIPNTYCVSDNTLTMTALDAGRYELTIRLKDEFVFDDAKLNTELTYVLIIEEMPIDAPRFNESGDGVSGNTKTVTYGGEKMADGVTDWVATLAFANADQSRISWVSHTLSQQTWSDSDLVLAGRSAKTYDVTFTPKPNYRWKDGVTVPTYSLIINKLNIADPVLRQDDGDSYDNGGSAIFTKTTKTIRYDGKEGGHRFKLEFPTLDSITSQNISYTKASSIEITYNGTFTKVWDGDFVTYNTGSAGTYTFEIFPTQNYCWSDGTTGAKVFTFIIQPIDISALHFYATNQYDSGIVRYQWSNALGGFHAILNYNEKEKTVRIGNENPVNDSERYVTTGDDAKSFEFLDENGVFIKNEGMTGVAAKLPEGVTDLVEADGFISFKATQAGVYRIGIMIVNPNYTWNETNESMVVYTLTINPEGIEVPVIDQSKCSGNDIFGHFGDASMHGTYYDVNFALAITLDDERYSEFIEVETPYGEIFTFDSSRTDSIVKAELDEALKETKGVYTDWYEKTLYFYAKDADDQGTYTWTVRINSPNHSWAGKPAKERELKYTIYIDRSPVSGMEMHYVGDTLENLDVLVENATNVRGGSDNAQTVKYEQSTYSEKDKVFYFVRSDTKNLVETGFSTQFSYSVNKFVMDSEYDVEKITDVKEVNFDYDELRLSALDAGTYEIIITPTDNYCWNDPGKTIGSVRFTLKIQKLTIDTPLVILDDGNTTTSGNKDAVYEYKYLMMQLDLLDFPKGYAIHSFEYVGDDRTEREDEGDLMPVKTEGKATLETEDDTNLGVDPETGRLSVQAQSAGEYLLLVVVSNVNNYQLRAGYRLEYHFNIDRRSVTMPDAYLDKVYLEASEADKLTQTDADVRAYANTENALKPNSENVLTTEFDSYYHSVYLFGDDVKLGDFVITVTGKTNNGMDDIKVFQPDHLIDGTSDTADYFKLTVLGVNTYDITLKFKTRDFYWGNDIASSAQTRSYKLVVTRKLINVPSILGENQLTLVDNRYTVEFPYVKDVAGTVNDSHRMITLTGVEFGVVLSTSPVKYAIINSKISDTSTANAVILTPDPDRGEITMQTSLDGVNGGEGKVQYTYVIELDIDPENMRWNTGAEGDILTKYYEIKITKQKVTNPYIIDTKNSTGNEKYVTYSGEEMGEILKIAMMDGTLIDAIVSDATTMTKDLKEEYTDAVYGTFKNLLLVSTKAPSGTPGGTQAGTYTVVAKLLDPDNSEWKDGSTDDITFTLIVEKMRVEKPYIHIPSNSTEAQEGVVGFTKTVTYENVPSVKEHVMNVGNFWADSSYDGTLASATDLPYVMTLNVENGTPKTKTYANSATLTDGKYADYFSNGLLSISAENAGKYILRFTLTSNAVWADGSEDYIDVTLLVNKKTHDDMFIVSDEPDDWFDDVTGSVKTYTYKLDNTGAPVEATMQLGNFDETLMKYSSLVSGTASSAAGDGYFEDLGMSADDNSRYDVKATNAGDYVVEFTLLDYANHRWAFADVASCTFTLRIKKLQLLHPVINTEYSPSNEITDGNTITVDYDKNLHTILVESLFGKVNNGAYSVLGDKYFTVEDTTASKNSAADPSYTPATHKTFTASYDAMAADTLIRDLFEDETVFDTTLFDPAWQYKGEHANSLATAIDTNGRLVNLFRLTAYTPGNYYLTFKLTDSDNMEWAGSTSDEIDFTVVINKVMHDAPSVASGTSTSQEYTGERVEFTLNNVFNGKLVQDGPVVGTASEKYEIIAYSGNDKALSDANDEDVEIAAANFAKFDFEVQWFNGVLVLGFTEVGKYTVRISITDTDYIGWNGMTDPFIDKDFTVDKRTVNADITFSAPGDPELDAKLREHNNRWYVTVNGGVDTELILKGLRDVPTATQWDQRLEFEVYYVDVKDTATKLGSKIYSDTGNPNGLTSAEAQGDGSYNMTLWYQEIGTGKGNIKKGKYLLYVAQIDTDGNHKLVIDPVAFEIEADPAPFKGDMLEWVYSRSTDPANTPYSPLENLGQTAENPFILDYTEDVSFTFIPQLKKEYQKGYDNSNPPTFQLQLATYYVKWDGSFTGNSTVSNATSGVVSVSIKITASDPDEYSFPDYVFTLYYKINKAKYDLSDLEWVYDTASATSEFTYEYDGAAKNVRIAPKAGTTLPTGLTPNVYKTTGTYTTTNNATVTNDPAANSNSRTNAGQYTTELVSFKVTGGNYEVPTSADPDSYTGTFDWTRSWTITPKHIVVDWVQGKTTSSTGDVVTRSQPKVDGADASKFSYKYFRQDETDPTLWNPVTTITRTPGQTLIYRAEAYLKDAGNYSRNFTFEFLGKDETTGNPLTFEVGGDDTEIFNTITVDGKIQDQYEYTGNAFVADTVIDFDTSNGQITRNNITILYSRRDPVTNEPIGAPTLTPYTEIGNYIVILKLSYSGTSEDFKLNQQTFIYDIIKAKLSADDFEWRVKHGDGEDAIEARFDIGLGGKWVNVATNEEVIIDYDGKAYEVYLYSGYSTSIIRFTYDDPSHIKAGAYTTTAMETMDTAHYEFDPANAPSLTFDWVIEKHLLDFKDVKWNYEQEYTFTVVNGTPKTFFAKIDNLPDYLSDKIEYKVYSGTDYIGDAESKISDAGIYRTEFRILEDKIDKDNYDLGSWPAAIGTTIEWKINRRAMEVPENDMSWTEFDGIQHNLLKPFGFDVDWNEYFDVVVTYTDFDGNVTNSYDGTGDYGNKYYAYNAGTYKFELKIKQQFNKDSSSNTINNIVWIVTDESGTRQTPNDQTVEYSVAKKALTVTGWKENFELSSVILAGNIDSTKFIDYKFYEGNTGDAGNPADLNDVLSSAGGDKFSMVPEVRETYRGNITLSFDSERNKFITFITPEIDENNAQKVDGKPYIYGYSINGVFTPFTNDEIASGKLSVEYTGEDITFRIYNWDIYYKDYVTVYGCSLDDLTQREAGEYKVTLILRTDLEKPLYWGKTADNKIDRSAVELTFTISYKMLTIPEIPAEVTYDGTVINILDKATNTTYAKLLAEYGNYVEITGNTAINAGEQTLYLTIKEEYGNAVRWNNGEEHGLVGTYSIAWKIIPVLIRRPERNLDARIEYDGQAHSVYEVLKGYDAKNPAPEMATLMANINEAGGRAIDAGNYHAVLSLPNDNYAWCDANGAILADRTAYEEDWSIAPKPIDFEKAFWGYTENGQEIEYDQDNPFVFTVVNGNVKNFSVEILGMPEILKLYTTYRTNGAPGNSASAVGTYTTTVEFDLSKIDTKNYELGTVPESILEIVWKIIPREIAVPEFDGSWTEFDGKLHDLASLAGLSEDWAEYLDVTVEYKATDSDLYAPYKGEDDAVVGYSNYTGYYYGFYKLSVAIRYDSTVTPENVKWAGGAAPEDVIIEVSELDINVIGWFEDDENSHVLFEDGFTLPEEIAERLEYIIYEDGDAAMKPVKPQDVVGGKSYYITYAIKTGNDEKGIAYNYGIKLNFAKGVPNPLDFGTGDYGAQPIIWLPAPVLKTAVLEYNGTAQTFEIVGYDTVYKLSYAKKNQLNALYSLGLGDDVNSFIYLQNPKGLTATSAGTYSAVIRLLSKVRLSWYDSTVYSVDSNGNLVYKDSGIPVADPENLFNNKSFTVNFEITPKRVPVLTDEDLEKLMGIIVGYDGTEKDVTVEAKEVFDELEAKYGKIFDYAGKTGTEATEYELTITLADLGSSFWYSEEPVDTKVSYEGYEFRYVQEGSGWKLVLVKIDSRTGNVEIDSAGNYIEFNRGDYKAEIEYLPDFETEFVEIAQETGDLINEDGTVNVANSYFLDEDGERFEISDGVYLAYTYDMDKTNPSVVVRYRYDETLQMYIADSEGDFVKRYKLDLGADPKYGYKVAKTEDVTEYNYLFSKLAADANGVAMAMTDGAGNYIDTYLYYDGTKYELRKYVVNADGTLENDGAGNYTFTVIEGTCQMADADGKTYALVNGKFVESALGGYMLRYVLDGGNRKQQIVYAKDDEGNLIVDTQYTVVTVPVYEKVNDVSYKVKWEISSAVLAIPEFDESLMKQYTGGTLYAKDVLKGFVPELMEIVEGGEGVNAGTYTAKIVLTTTNSKWDPNATKENYVLVTWRIDTAKIDFSNVKWVFSDGTNTYDDSSDFVYTRKDGKPVVYWAQLANLPEALNGRVIYNTNGRPGAYAGTDAGKYETTVKFDTDSNFENFEVPERLQQPVTWHIKRRVLDVPQIGPVWMIFDNEQHNLLEILGVPEDWNEYYDIRIQYAENFIEYTDYYGYEGDRYLAFGSGAYKFTLSIKTGINTTVTNPNVVWASRNSDVTEPPETPGVPDTPDEGGEDEGSQTPEPSYALEAAPVPTGIATDEVPEAAAVLSATGEEKPVTKKEVKCVMTESNLVLHREVKVPVKEVCERLKELAFCAESHIKSFRKYLICTRGTV